MEVTRTLMVKWLILELKNPVDVIREFLEKFQELLRKDR